jgi:NIPSNAP
LPLASSVQGGWLDAMHSRPLTSAPIVATKQSSNRKKTDQGVKSMIYETRVYRCLPGRLPALLKRFETTTLKLWEKHGIRQAGFFTTLVGESNQELTYLLAWESLAEREKKWTAFQADPDWIAARAKTEEDGQIVGNIVNQLLVPTKFSAVK